MADYMGIYDKLFNTAYTNAPRWMRTEAMLSLFKVYDNVWRPVLQDLFPRTSAPPLTNGVTPNIDTEFLIPNTADPQSMSDFYDYYEMPVTRAIAYGEERMQCRMIKEWGPRTHPKEYAEEFKAGFLDKRNQILLQNQMRSMSRRMEYELVHYVQGNQNVMSRYGSQYDKQIATNSLLKTFTLPTDLGGKTWDDTSSNPMDDMIDIELYLNEFGKTLKEAYIGANTAAGLEKNTAVYDLVKYHYDATRNPIAASIKGVGFKKVIGQTYKDSSLNSTRVGYPGMGDVRRDGWTTRRRIKMMVNGGKEWGLFVSGPLGNTYTAKTDPQHNDTNVAFANEWQDPRTKFMFSELCLGFAPYVYNFSDLIIVNDMATVNV